MDFVLLARILQQEGVVLAPEQRTPEALARAEAAARVELTRWLEQGHSTEATATWPRYVGAILQRLGAAPEDLRLSRLEALTQLLKSPQHWDALWSRADPALRGLFAELRGRGMRLVVISNADGTVARKLRGAGLDAAFDAVLDSHELGVEKPDPAIFRLALEVAHCAPHEALHVGDLPSVDYLGARAVGCHACVVDPYGDWQHGGWSGEPFPCVPDLATLCRELLASEDQAEH